MTIEELIPQTNIETETIEFKGIIEEGKAETGKVKEIGWLKTLAAFANTDGGNLYVGVENTSHKILALDHETCDKLILMVHRQIKNRIEPILNYKISSIIVPETSPSRYILKISVAKSKVLPIALHEEGLLGIYIRKFGSTVLATSEQIRDMILLSDNNPFDQPFTEQFFSAKDFQKLFQIYEDKTGERLTEKALISVGFMNKENQLCRGALLFRDNNADEKTQITATLWPELTKGSSVILASESFTGNLFDAIEFARSFIKNHSVFGFKKEENTRVDYISYPPRSVTEGIVNAIAHRNYFMSGTQIEINLFKDRLEITSPGSLLGVRFLKKEKNISSIIPHRRNEVICSVLELCRYMESKGSGFDKIEQDYNGKGEHFMPYVSSDESSFTLVLPNLTFTQGIIDEKNIPEIYTESLLEDKNSEKILAFCFKVKRSAKEIAEYLSIQPSTYFRKEIVEKLVEKKLLLTQKEGRTTYYISNVNKVFVREDNSQRQL